MNLSIFVNICCEFVIFHVLPVLFHTFSSWWRSESIVGKHDLLIHAAVWILSCLLFRFSQICTRQVWWRSWRKRTRSTPTWFQRSSPRSWRLWGAECTTSRRLQQSQPWVLQTSRSWRRRSAAGLHTSTVTPRVTKPYPPVCRLKKWTCRLIRWSIRGWWETIPWTTSWRCTGSRWGVNRSLLTSWSVTLVFTPLFHVVVLGTSRISHLLLIR